MANDAFVATPIDDYELLDFGRGRRLERFGRYVLERPDARATGACRRSDWYADWIYVAPLNRGTWEPQRQGLHREWFITIEGLRLTVRLGEGGEVGLRPEEIIGWRWVRQRLEGCYHIADLRMLNLFAGTGGCSLAAISTGAHVTHVSAQAAHFELAQANVTSDAVNLVHADIRPYVEQMLRDGRRFHLVALTPPTFARGRQQTWDIKVDLQHVIRELPRLTTADCRGIWLGLAGGDWTADSVARWLSDTLPGRSVEALQLGIATADGRVLPAGVAARWFDDSDSTLAGSHQRRALSAHEIEERLDVYLDPVLSSRRTAAGPARSLAELPRGQQDFALHWIEVICRTSGEMAYQIAAHAAQAFGVLEERAVEAWIVRAIDVYDTAGLHPAIAALQEIDSFARELKEKAHSVVFADVVGILEHFVHGLSGRKLRVECGEESYTDTETLFLPAMVTRFPAKEDNFLLYKALLVHQWAQCCYGTHQADLPAALAGYPDPERARQLFHALEALRLNARIARALPGLYRRIEGLCARLQIALVPRGWEQWAQQLTAEGAGVDATLELLAQVFSEASLPPRLPFYGQLKPERAAQVRAARIAREKALFRHLLLRLGRDLEPHDEATEEPSEPRPARRFQLRRRCDEEPQEQSRFELELDGQPLAPPPELAGLMESIIQDLGDIPADYLVAAGEGPYHMREHAPSEATRDPWSGTYHEEGAFLYNEWDFKRSHYRKNWCVLREMDVHPHSPAFVSHTFAKYHGLVQNIRRTFEVLRGEEKILKRQTHGDDVDIDAVVEAHADVMSGLEMSERLFTKLQKVERSIAVMFMVDMSGSTKGWINDAERESLVLLCEALEILGDRYAVYGFSGWTRKRCELYRVKRFDEPYNDEVKARISGIRPRDYTRMGVTIRHLSRLLEEVDARTKLLITLSDGKPDDFDGYRGEYGIEDTRMALIEAKRSGIHPFCITIDKEGHDYLPHMYGAVNYTLIDDVRKLPLRVSDIYRRLTT
nr:class I SAM-dependent methyltransferase [Gammaproteobacteria bacterium]